MLCRPPWCMHDMHMSYKSGTQCALDGVAWASHRASSANRLPISETARLLDVYCLSYVLEPSARVCGLCGRESGHGHSCCDELPAVPERYIALQSSEHRDASL